MSAVVIRAPCADPQADALLADACVPCKAPLLDREGLINVNHGYAHSAAITEWLSGWMIGGKPSDLEAAATAGVGHLYLLQRADGLTDMARMFAAAGVSR